MVLKGRYFPAKCTPITHDDELSIVKEASATRLPKLVSRGVFKDPVDPTKPADEAYITDLIDNWTKSNRECLAYRSSRTRNILKQDTKGYEIPEPSSNQKFTTIPTGSAPCLILDGFDHVIAYKFSVPMELIETLEDSALQLPQSKRACYSLTAQKLYEVNMSTDYRKDLPESREFIERNEDLFNYLDNTLRLLRPDLYKECVEIDRYLGPDERRLAGAWHGATINRDTGNEEDPKPRKNFREWSHSLSAMIPFGEYRGGSVKFYNLGMEFELQPGEVLFYNGRILSYAVQEITEGYRHSLDLAVLSTVTKSSKGKGAHKRRAELERAQRPVNVTIDERTEEQKREAKRAKSERKRQRRKERDDEKRKRKEERRKQRLEQSGAEMGGGNGAPGAGPIRNLDHLYTNEVKSEQGRPAPVIEGTEVEQTSPGPAERSLSQPKPYRATANERPGFGPIRNLDHLYTNTKAVKLEQSPPPADLDQREVVRLSSEPPELSIAQARPSRAAAGAAIQRIKEQREQQAAISAVIDGTSISRAQQSPPQQAQHSQQPPSNTAKNPKRERTSDATSQPVKRQRVENGNAPIQQDPLMITGQLGNKTITRPRKQPLIVSPLENNAKTQPDENAQNQLDSAMITGKLGNKTLTRPRQSITSTAQASKAKRQNDENGQSQPSIGTVTGQLANKLVTRPKQPSAAPTQPARVKAEAREPAPVLRVKSETEPSVPNVALKQEQTTSKITTEIVGGRMVTVECLD